MPVLDTANRIVDAAEICLGYIKESGAITFLDINRALDSVGLSTSYESQVPQALRAYGVKMERVGSARKRLNISVSPTFQGKWKHKGLYYLTEEGLKQWFSEHQE